MKAEITDFADVGHEERWGWMVNESWALGLSKEEDREKQIIGWGGGGVGIGNKKLLVRASLSY